MIRFITFIIIAGVVYWLWKWTMNRYERVKNDYLGRGVPKEGEQGKMSELVQDPVCKLYIAKDQAITYKEQFFCSEKCRQAFDNPKTDGGN